MGCDALSSEEVGRYGFGLTKQAAMERDTQKRPWFVSVPADRYSVSGSVRMLQDSAYRSLFARQPMPRQEQKRGAVLQGRLFGRSRGWTLVVSGGGGRHLQQRPVRLRSDSAVSADSDGGAQSRNDKLVSRNCGLAHDWTVAPPPCSWTVPSRQTPQATLSFVQFITLGY